MKNAFKLIKLFTRARPCTRLRCADSETKSESNGNVHLSQFYSKYDCVLIQLVRFLLVQRASVCGLCRVPEPNRVECAILTFEVFRRIMCFDFDRWPKISFAIFPFSLHFASCEIRRAIATIICYGFNSGDGGSRSNSIMTFAAYGYPPISIYSN